SILLLLNCEKAKRRLGWTPLWDVDRSISETVEWYRFVHGGGSAPEITEWQIRAYMEGRRGSTASKYHRPKNWSMTAVKSCTCCAAPRKSSRNSVRSISPA